MQFDFNFYSALLLIFVSNGLLFSVLLYVKAKQFNQNSNTWLSLFVLICCLYIMPWMLGFAGWYDKQPYRDIVFYIPFQHLYFIGPVLYCFVQSILNPAFKFNKRTLLHFVPGILYLIYSLAVFITDKMVLQRYYFLADGIDRDFDSWYQYSGFVSMIFYFILSFKFYQKYVLLMQNLVSFADNLLFKWLKNFLIAFLSMQVLQVVFFVLGLFFAIETYVGSWWYFFCFAIITYYIALTGYSNNLQAQIPFQFSALANAPILLLPYNQNPGTDTIIIDQEIANQPISDEVLQFKNQILDLFQTEKLYQNPELTLADIAKKVQSNSSVISKVINQGFKVNFNDFVNQYRIDQVKNAFQNQQHKKNTLLGIAFDCGFNSKATFNRAFKKHTTLSPKQYIESFK